MLDSNDNIFKVDVYPDADFAGIYGNKRHDDPECAKSCTGFIITFSDFPVLWISKLQTKTILSTMEAEIIDLSRLSCILFPIIGITQYL